MAGGAYFEPTLLTEVRPELEIARTEVFGPVLSVLRWSDEAEVVAAANGTDYGLTAAVHTENLERALYFARRLEAGSIAINGAGGQHWFGAPFGGYKQSGLGREDGINELLEATQEKNVNINLRRAP
jgi:betaine-aldehyde dehydrogenase